MKTHLGNSKPKKEEPYANSKRMADYGDFIHHKPVVYDINHHNRIKQTIMMH